MTSNSTQAPPSGAVPTAAADLQDERLLRDAGLRGAVIAFGRRVRSGDLGSLPVVIGLVVIWAAFEILSGGIFLQPDNLVNLAVQSAGPGLISVGVVLVLLLGEIDLSVGSVSGLAASIMGAGLTVLNWPFWSIVLVALGAGAGRCRAPRLRREPTARTPARAAGTPRRRTAR